MRSQLQGALRAPLLAAMQNSRVLCRAAEGDWIVTMKIHPQEEIADKKPSITYVS
jgi:hypothetical protein